MSSVTVKNLAQVSVEEQLTFLKSFDHVLCDVDGVILLSYKAIPGAAKCTETLKECGKQIHYVSNNTTMTIKRFRQILADNGFAAKEEDIVTPIAAILSHLRKLKFDRKIFAITTAAMTEELKNAGFLLAEHGPKPVVQNLQELLAQIKPDDADVGGVLVDFDANLTYVKLQKAVEYLKNPDVIFLSGAQDLRLPVTKEHYLMGPKYFIDGVEGLAGRKAHQLAKPSANLKEFVSERFDLLKPERVLFIGDTIYEDMNFASKCGYQKLMVLTGVTKENDLKNWTFPEEFKPNYFIESLDAFDSILKSHLQ